MNILRITLIYVFCHVWLSLTVTCGQSNELPARTESELNTSSLNTLIAESTKQPLYIVDGVEEVDVKRLDPKMIKSIDTIKPGSALLNEYGPRGVNGVILIVTRKEPTPLNSIRLRVHN